MDWMALLSPALGLLLTLVIFSYLLHDNGLYRFAVLLLAGMSLTYALLVMIANVLIPRVVLPVVQVISGQGWDAGMALTAAVPLLLGTFILFKLSPRWAPLGNWGMAVLIGVGAGLAVGGALVGSLLGLADASTTLNVGAATGTAFLALVSTVTVLMHFWYTGSPERTGLDRRNPVIRAIAGIGRVFLMITFGALFGGALVTGIATLVERLYLVAQIVQAFPIP
jgi:hypothetical protein